MLKRLIIYPVVSFGVTIFVALGLILSDRPTEIGNEDTKTLEFGGVVSTDFSGLPAQEHVKMTDGWDMPVRRYGKNSESKPLLIFLHGSSWVGLQFHHLAKSLSEDAYVVVPDLRGHGERPERRGDVDYIGQMEDDIATLITSEDLATQKVILAGHSSGGGLVIRFAGGEHGDMLNEAILLAPYLKYNAPTIQKNSGGWVRVMTRRIIGLSMLNAFKITALNHLPVIQFNAPKALREGKYRHLTTLAYSFRLNTGYAPRSNYLQDVASLPNFTVIAGADDEAFYAEKFEEVMSAVTQRGSYHILSEESHLSVVNSVATESLIRSLLK